MSPGSATAAKLAADAGHNPRLHRQRRTDPPRASSPGGHHDLTWAFGEAANAIGLHRQRVLRRHGSRLSERVARGTRRPSGPSLGI
jgi:hypothetical protein